jgi:hypothetical protein
MHYAPSKYSMKKLTAICGAAALLCVSSATAANYYINNAVTGESTDWLFQDSDGSALNGGIVALGYFSGGAPSSSINDISATIAAFNLQHSGITGTYVEDLEGSYAGYVQVKPILVGSSITAPNSLIGQNMYLFVGNRATLASSTAWALAVVRKISDDLPFTQQYDANPNGTSIYGGAAGIGEFSTFTGDVGLGSFTYNTLRLQPIPEPSSLILASLGVLALFRRRR